MKKLSSILIIAFLCFQAPFSQQIQAMDYQQKNQQNWWDWFKKSTGLNKAQKVITRPFSNTNDNYEQLPDLFPNKEKQEKAAKKQRKLSNPNALLMEWEQFKESTAKWNWGNIAKVLTGITAATGLSIAVYNNGELIKTFGESVAQVAISAASKAIQEYPQYAIPAAITGGTALVGAATKGISNAALNWQANTLLNQIGGISYGDGAYMNNLHKLTELEKTSEAKAGTAAYRAAKETLEDVIKQQKP